MTTQNTDSNSLAPFFAEYGYYLTLIIAMTAMLGSLYFSEVLHYEPCRLCWFQRIAMYPITAITLVGIIKQDDYLPNYVLPLSLIGICISIFHILIQNGIIVQSSGCTTVLCSIKYINWFGFISIPVLAGTAFFLINILMFMSWKLANQAE